MKKSELKKLIREEIQRQKDFEFRNKRRIEQDVLEDINRLLASHPVLLFSPLKSDSPLKVEDATEVVLVDTVRNFGKESKSSVVFGQSFGSASGDILHISPNLKNGVQSTGGRIPGDSYKTNEEGIKTMIEIVQKVLDKSGWDDDDKVKTIIKASNYFNRALRPKNNSLD